MGVVYGGGGGSRGGGGRDGREEEQGRRKPGSMALWPECLYMPSSPSPAPPAKIHMWNSTLRVVIRRCGAFGSPLDHEARTHRNGISAFIKETPQSSLLPSAI